jgi:hypothetical protein
MYLDATKKILKSHFAALQGEREDVFRREWEAKIADMTDKERKVVFELLQSQIK